MKIPFKYTIRSIFARRLTMTLTVLGVSMVSFVFAAVLMLAAGLKETLVASGSDDNAILIRESSVTEMNSFISRYQAGVIQTLPEIELDSDGQALVAGELVVLINKNKIGTNKLANILVRGVAKKSLALRDNIKIISGRMFEFGKTEIIVGEKNSHEFENCDLGETLVFGNTNWTVVGIFESGGSAFESEVWGDVDQLMPAFGRPVFSSMIFRMKDPSAFEAMRERVMADPRMTVDLKRERVYYAEQSRTLTTFITVLGIIISVIFSVGAIIGAMITMYAAVANRTVEIATMRALGYKRRNILIAFLIESLVISLMGGIIGLLAASALQSLRISTINWDTFSNLSFGFSLTTSISVSVMIFALAMGILGGFLPAIRASRIKIVEALRAA
jgi:putative ABC transport system permease protein